MGFVLVGLVVGAVVYLFWIMVKPRSEFEIQGMEQVDLIEGSSIVEQQKWGRERWRQAEVELPSRPLTFEEQQALDTIQTSGSQQVKIKRG